VRISSDCAGPNHTCGLLSNSTLDLDSTECSRAYHGSVAILLFGELNGSHQRQRQRLCDAMHRDISGMSMDAWGGSTNGKPNVLCMGGFGNVLERFVCRAHIVVVEHYYAHSALETHRIDPLLLAKKLVFVTPSADPELEKIYSPWLVIAPRDDIVQQLAHLLGSDEERHRLARRKYKAYQQHPVSLDPLCFALNSLSSDFDRHAQAGVVKVSRDHNFWNWGWWLFEWFGGIYVVFGIIFGIILLYSKLRKDYRAV
jgi:hypothetical protein